MICKKLRSIAKEMRHAIRALRAEIEAAVEAGPTDSSFKVLGSTKLFTVVARACLGLLVHWMIIMEKDELEDDSFVLLDKALIGLLSFVQGLQKVNKGFLLFK